MKSLTSIVATNVDGVIGVGNGLPWRVRSDLRFFREQTLNQVVIMGRKTFDSLGRKGLPNRKNVIVTHGFGLNSPPRDCRIAYDIVEGLAIAHSWCNQRQRVFIVGGATMYEQYAPYVDRYLITLIDKKIEAADTFLSNGLAAQVNSWPMKTIALGSADADAGDEANYGIFEFTRADESALTRRVQQLSAYAARRQGNSLVNSDWRARATA